MKADRLVVDTNVLISAGLSPNGVCGQLLRWIQLTDSILLLCPETRDELVTRFSRPKFAAYVDAEQVIRFIRLVRAGAEEIGIEGRRMGCRDASDDMFLELAAVGHADVIVSGDSDLLAMHPFRGIPIVSPAEFLSSASPAT